MNAWALALAVVLLVANGFFVAVEFALIASRRTGKLEPGFIALKMRHLMTGLAARGHSLRVVRTKSHASSVNKVKGTTSRTENSADIAILKPV